MAVYTLHRDLHNLPPLGGPAQNCCKYSGPAVSIKRTAALSAASLLKSTSCPFQNLCLQAPGNPGINTSSSPNRSTLSQDENLQTQLKSLGIKKQTSNQPTKKSNQTKTNTNPTKQNKQNKPSKNKKSLSWDRIINFMCFISLGS